MDTRARGLDNLASVFDLFKLSNYQKSGNPKTKQLFLQKPDSIRLTIVSQLTEFESNEKLAWSEENNFKRLRGELYFPSESVSMVQDLSIIVEKIGKRRWELLQLIWTMWIYYRTMAHGPWKIHELRGPIKWAGRKIDFRRQSVKLRTNWRAERRRQWKGNENVYQNANNFSPTINVYNILLFIIKSQIPSMTFFRKIWHQLWRCSTRLTI